MNPHPHPSLQQAAQRSLWLSVVVNVVLTLLQIVTGLWAGSQALVADALHSLSDLIADFVALLARRHSHKAPDDDHHYGHQRYETAASLALGLLLLGAGASMLLGAGNKITSATPLAPVHQAALWVALLTLLSKELLFRYMLKIATEVKSSMLVANAWHARADAASSLVVRWASPATSPATPGSIRWRRRWSASWSARPAGASPGMRCTT